MSAVLGTLGSTARGTIDARGAVASGGVALDWWVGGDDKWHVPADAPGVRHKRVGPAPVYETRVRVPSGDAVQRVYAAGGPGDPIVMAVENDSPAPFALALVVSTGKADARLDGNVLHVGSDVELVMHPAPRFWATGPSARETVLSGAATADGPTEWRAPGTVVLLVPVTHRTTATAALSWAPVDLGALADVDAVQRGWLRQLERGLRTELPEEWQDRVDSARADVLLAEPDAAVAAALEDWGFDSEFEAVWDRLGLLARRAARKRAAVADPWSALSGAEGVEFLAAMRTLLVAEHDGYVDVLPGFPDEWRGVNLAVHDVPLRAGGTLSYALRWHGERPALLWDAPASVELHASRLAPEWRGAGGEGETLIA